MDIFLTKKNFYRASVRYGNGSACGYVKAVDTGQNLTVIDLSSCPPSISFCSGGLLKYDYTKCVDILNLSISIARSLADPKLDSYIAVNFKNNTPIADILVPVCEKMNPKSCRIAYVDCFSFVFEL